MTALAKTISSQLCTPAQLVGGLWYLHLMGQCYKRGPRGGLALLITCDPAERIEIPGAGYSFGDLIFALALGDFDAMLSRRRLPMAGPPEQSLAELESVVERALKAARRKR